MAQKDIDKLLALTDSKYRLANLVAKRAAQLKSGLPTLLEPEERPRTRNTVTVAMREMLTGRLAWGKNIVKEERLSEAIQAARAMREAEEERSQVAPPAPPPLLGG